MELKYLNNGVILLNGTPIKERGYNSLRIIFS